MGMEDVFLGCASEEFSEVLLQPPARDRDASQDILNGDRLLRVRSDVADGGDDILILGGHDIRRLARNHAGGRDQDGSIRRRRATLEVMDQFRSLATNADRADIDAADGD